MAGASGPPGLSLTSIQPPGQQALTSPPAASLVSPEDGPWIAGWLSAARFSRYVAHAGGDRSRARALYEWNAQVGAAFQRDLAYVEVGLRNHYDEAAQNWGGAGHWLLDGYRTVFSPLFRTKRGSGGARIAVDVNVKPRQLVEQAIQAAGGPSAKPGKVVAELSLGFWRYLSSSAHEKTLWVPYLHRAFPPGTARVYVDERVGRLHSLRNRVAHHEHLLNENLPGRSGDIIELAAALHPELAAHIRATSVIPALLAQQP